MAAGRQDISFGGMLVLAFFWVSGGIYGNEALLKNAGVGPTFLLLGLLGPLFVGIPLALMSIDLASAHPLDGGLAAWVAEAFPQRWLAPHVMLWLYVVYCIDSAIYPVLLANYFAINVNLDHFPGGHHVGIAVVATVASLLVMAVQLGGTAVLVTFNTLFMFISLAPALVFVLAGLKDLRPAGWLEWGFLVAPPDAPVSFDDDDDDPAALVPGTTKWVLIISWVSWLYVGFRSFGMVSAELRDPVKTLSRVLAAVTPIIVAVNVLPLAVCAAYELNHSRFEAGLFDKIASQRFGRWLGWMFLVGALVSQIGLLNAVSMASHRALYRFVQIHFPDRSAPHILGPLTRRQRAWHYMWVRDDLGVPRSLICLTTLIICILCWLPYTVLVETSMMLFCPCLLLFVAAYIRLKRRAPARFAFNGVLGWLPAIVGLAALPATATVAQVVLSFLDDEAVLGVPYFKLVAMCAVVVSTYAVHLGYHVLVGRDIASRSCHGHGHGHGPEPEAEFLLATESDPLLADDSASLIVATTKLALR